MLAVVLALGAVSCAEEPEAVAPPSAPLAEAVGESVCVSIRRLGGGGVVSDATIAMDPADPSLAGAAFGSGLTLAVGATGSALRQTLLRFDLSVIPSNVHLDMATLVLRKATSTGPGPLEVHRVTAPWSEGTVTWNSFAQAFDPAVEASITPAAIAPGGFAYVPITPLMQAWNDGSLANEGVVLTEAASGGRATFGASEASVQSRPYLTVCYQAPTCSDGLSNQGEQGVDCGGPCAPCLCVSPDGCHQGTLDAATGACVVDQFSAVAAGWFFSCGLRTDGTAVCWGQNTSGQASAPAGAFAALSAGFAHACGLAADGTVTCWGDDTSGQASPPPGTFTQVDAGGYHTCGVKTDGTVACWGAGYYGQSTPPAGTFTQVRADFAHTCGIRTDGSVACWGPTAPYLDYGQANPPAGTFVELATGQAHTCGVKTDGTVVCWGDNTAGQLTAPAGTFVEISAGTYYTCGLRTDGTITCWGVMVPGAVPPPGAFAHVSAGRTHAQAVGYDGVIITWGTNYSGEAVAPVAPPLAFGTPCDDGDACTTADACNGGVCVGTPSCPTCSDGIQNQGELVVDCGGPCSPCQGCLPAGAVAFGALPGTPEVLLDPSSLASDGARILAAPVGLGHIYAFDPLAFQVTSTMTEPVFGNVSLAADPVTGDLFYGSGASSSVARYRLGASGAIELGPLLTASLPLHGQAWDPLGGALHVARANVATGTGDVLVTDASYTPTGSYGGSLLTIPHGVAVGAALDRVAVSNQLPGLIYVFDRTTHALLATLDGTSTGTPFAFNAVLGLAYDDAGILWVADRMNDRVVAFDANGSVVQTLGGLNEPVSVAYHEGTGCLFVAEYNSALSVPGNHSRLLRYCGCP